MLKPALIWSNRTRLLVYNIFYLFSVNAAMALTTQIIDTLLVICLRPYSDIGVNRTEVCGGITNLFAFFSVASPVLFGKVRHIGVLN